MIASDVTCLDSCTRQENKIFVSERTFPNKMFPSSADFFLVIRKLWWSCQPEKNKFGPKRSILEKDFPDLCPYYDNFIYQNRMVNNFLMNADYFLNRPMVTFLKDLNMTTIEMENFKEEILKYSRKNLVKITAYIEKVFAAQYMTDQVGFKKLGIYQSLKPLPGYDFRHSDCQPRGYDGPLHGVLPS